MPDSNTGPTYFPEFRNFIESLDSATHEEYSLRHLARVRGVSEFNTMKAHILNYYEGVEVPHSFVDSNGQVFDCIPIEQQPALRDSTVEVAAIPDSPQILSTGPPRDHQAIPIAGQLRSDRVDKYGHSMRCPPGTIPVRRITLDELTKWEALDQFFSKSPIGRGRHPRLSADPSIASGVHKYAHAYQGVDNLGGHSFLNVWDPAVGSQVFSLSQHWYAGGSPVQTAECGWQVFPAKYNTTQPVLFIYWTADDYKTTGAYNLEGSHFIQTSSSWAIGGTLAAWDSAYGGAQYEIEMQWYLTGGNWWLYLGGNAVGYYPGSQYGGGQLASSATNIDYGGEVVDNTSWPPMGSGSFANAGYSYTAYQRDIEYISTGGGLVSASLTPQQLSPSCFTISVQMFAAPWNETIYFGGPGGTGCA